MLTFLKPPSSGGGKHRGIIENVVADMYDGTPLFLVKIKGDVVVVREGAMTAYVTKKKKI